MKEIYSLEVLTVDGHEKRGEAMIEEIAAALSLPRTWSRSAAFAAREHMRTIRMKTPAKIRDLIRALENEAIGADGFAVITAADNHGDLPAFLNDYDRLLELVKKASKCTVPEGLEGPRIGEYIRSREIEALRHAYGRAKRKGSADEFTGS